MIDESVGLAPGAKVLEVEYGTGIVARQLAASGGKVVAIEPNDGMATCARTHGMAPVETATFEAWDAAGRRFDSLGAGLSRH